METKKIILSGGPHTGKTSIFEKLKTIFPDFDYVKEAGTSVIEKKIKLKNKNYMGDFSWNIEFQKLVIDEQIKHESKISKSVCILDRSLIDCAAYLRMHGFNKKYLEILKMVKNINIVMYFSVIL